MSTFCYLSDFRDPGTDPKIGLFEQLFVITENFLLEVYWKVCFRMNPIRTQKIDSERGLVNGKHLIRKASMARQKKSVAFMVMMLPKQR